MHNKPYMSNRVLVTWVGRTDLKASAGDPEVGLGPIGQAVEAFSFTDIHLLCNFQSSEGRTFLKWLASRTDAKIRLHQISLSSPTHFGDIYQGVLSVLQEIQSGDTDLTYHLSPGTPSMSAVWILLAKTSNPARLIQSSREAGVEEADIPFDIAAEFIPKMLQQSDRRLIQLVQGAPAENAEFSAIIHRSAVMQRVIEQGKRVAPRTIPVLIEGESGTGKELMARAIHHYSLRFDRPFIPVNCGAISPELVESEFFGHKKGAFTGAIADRMGHFERANGGTLFLDEIGELPKAVQVKLLRTLQDGVVTPVGSSDERKVDVRIIAATNRTLINEVAAGNFREDLFYRLAVGIIKLPPLRARAGDISLLIDKLLIQVNESGVNAGLLRKKLSVSAKNLMLQHRWPGNIRELLNTLQRAAVWSDEDTIGAEAMRDAILAMHSETPDRGSLLDRPIEEGVVLEDLMATLARHYLKRALEHTHNNKTQAASFLGLGSYQTLSNWMSRYGVEG
jgi:DNA-binding NtrC family response regulator